MRVRSAVLAGAGACLMLAVVVDAPMAYASSRSVGTQRQSLASRLGREQRQGLAPATVAQLRLQLDQVAGSWWSPGYFFSNPQGELDSVRRANSQDWKAALTETRASARQRLTEYQQYVANNGAWLSDPNPALPSTWSSRLSASTTPGALLALTSQIRVQLAQVQSAVAAAEAKAAAKVSLAEGPGGLLTEASQLEAIAKSDNLSSLGVPAAAASLRQALDSGQDGNSQNAALSQQLSLLRAEIGLNDQLVQQSRTVMDLVDQAAAEQTPNSATYLSQYQGSQTSLDAAQTAAQLSQVKSTLGGIQQATQASLSSDPCGHSTISGKSIYISLSLQEMVFYDNGCAVQATPVTTGRPQLRTPTGTFHIFEKESPYVFVSPWPPSSPFWYPTSPVNWVMEFDQGGYYIHDAPWEPTSYFGPGSENDLDAASHGCVHTPESVMGWVYNWTPLGTPVVIVS